MRSIEKIGPSSRANSRQASQIIIEPVSRDQIEIRRIPRITLPSQPQGTRSSPRTGMGRICHLGFLIKFLGVSGEVGSLSAGSKPLKRICGLFFLRAGIVARAPGRLAGAVAVFDGGPHGKTNPNLIQFPKQLLEDGPMISSRAPLSFVVTWLLLLAG